jgi:tRNA-(ms[2]io[6]A)-hydroxylase
LIAKHIDDAELQKFYHAIAKSEARHWHLFVTLARNLCPHLPVDARFCELAELENALVAELPLRPALH